MNRGLPPTDAFGLRLMLVLLTWGVWKTALRFGLRQRYIAVNAALALGWRQAIESPLPNPATQQYTYVNG